MKLTSFSTIIVLLLATSSIFFISPIQCHLPKPDLVDHICRHTGPHYHLCVLILKAHMKSHHLRASANLAGFTRVALDVLAANASATLQFVHTVSARANGDGQLKAALDGCTASYTKIVNECVPEAVNCIAKGDYKGVKDGAVAAVNQTDSCEKGFKDPSTCPLKDANRFVRDLVAITVSFVDKLLRPDHQILA